MELWLWPPVGGLVGTVLMDLTASLAEALRIRWGGCGGNAAIGRWVFGLLAGRFVHKKIIESSCAPQEIGTPAISALVVMPQPPPVGIRDDAELRRFDVPFLGTSDYWHWRKRTDFLRTTSRL